MLSLNDVLVSTTSTIEGAKIKKYIKPVSAHVVAGTNFFSDFFASFSDVFGGRSAIYQHQLSSIYKEAITTLKISAFEVGANCIVGLSVDLDEISGKGKSMFMVTATGTAVLLEIPDQNPEIKIETDDKIENVSLERIITFKKRKEIVELAQAGKLQFEDDTWTFLVQNKIDEVFNYVLDKLKYHLNYIYNEPELFNRFYRKTLEYLAALPEEKRYNLVYTALVNEQHEKIIPNIILLIRDLQLLNLRLIKDYLQSENFEHRKIALRPLICDKPFYNKDDIQNLKDILDLINNSFPERGKRSFKKQMLSSKEKEVWSCECECNKQHDIADHCYNCGKDIYGFKSAEVTPIQASEVVKEKIELIESCLN